MSGKKGMKHYPLAVKLTAVRMYQEEGKSQQEITELLEIRDPGRVKKWLRAYRQDGAQAFQAGKSGKKRGRPPKPKQENTAAYIARLEMENDLLKKYHGQRTTTSPNCASWSSLSAISAHPPPKGKIRSEGDVQVLWCFASSLLCLGESSGSA